MHVAGGGSLCEKTGRNELISLQAHLGCTKDSWRAGKALLIATNVPYPYCLPAGDQGKLMAAMMKQQLNACSIAGAAGVARRMQAAVERDFEAADPAEQVAMESTREGAEAGRRVPPKLGPVDAVWGGEARVDQRMMQPGTPKVCAGFS